MNTSKIFAGILFLILIFSEKTLAQSESDQNTFPLTIPFIEIYDLDTTYNTLWATRIIPRKHYHSIKDFVYKLVITITVVGNETWNKPFALVYEIPDYTKELIVVNEERYDLLPDRFNQFIVEVHTKKKGWAKFELAEYDELTGEAYIPQNTYPLRRRDFLFE
jgi:hypothetical protein